MPPTTHKEVSMYDDSFFDNPYEWDDPDMTAGGTYRPAWAEPFAEPGGRSALRAASNRNPRNLPCPTCGMSNRLTPADQRLGYQCNVCADRDEGQLF